MTLETNPAAPQLGMDFAGDDGRIHVSSEAPTATLTEDQKTLADIRKYGTPEQLAEFLTETPQAAEQVRTPEQIQLDEAFPVAKAEEFDMQWGDTKLTPELQKVDTEMRSWLTTAGVDRLTGQNFISEASQIGKKRAAMGESAYGVWAENEHKAMESRLGKEGYAAKRQESIAFFNFLEQKHPGVKARIAQSGMLDSQMAQNLLFSFLEVRKMRGGR